MSKIPEIKMILLGESGVGKTSIIKRYLEDQFDKNETSTLSMSYVGKTVNIDNKEVRLNIWDTIGQEKYRSISKLFLNETKIVILVYSIDNGDSFKELNYWYDLYKELLGEETILGVAGNKMDLYLNQEVEEEKAKEFAESRGAIFSLVSAKDNKESIDNYITKLVKAYLNKDNPKKEDNNNNEKGNIIKLEEKNVGGNTQSENGCCSGKKKNKKKDENNN